ncbi:hypothetical protein BCR34DRAFT_574052 [Clohesyomyces aquaticus]|uniref:Uncharacterized protein n=1 Tax=Clohesyomyces aquaticus TaxID=1231657 RepID=A0A1Y1YYA0_9PLEO|nr:hypothetical protein BCR34DRAFT_574052 [Clohesyomyces aquaticus]
MASPQTQPFRLLDLPAEIRLRIYQITLCCFDSVSPQSRIPPCIQRLEDIHPKAGHDGIFPATHSIETAILRTCKQVHREAYDIMVKTNQFIRIESYDVPLSNFLVQSQIPIVTLDRARTKQFQGYVMHLTITRVDDGNWDEENMDIEIEDFTPDLHAMPSAHQRGPYFNFMILARDWEAFCQMLAAGDVYGEGFTVDSMFAMQIGPKPERPDYQDDITKFFTDKIQKALLEPVRKHLRGFPSINIYGNVSHSYADGIMTETEKPAWPDPTQTLSQLYALKETGNQHYRTGNLVLACQAWVEARFTMQRIRGGTSWANLRHRGGTTFRMKLAELRFTLCLNCAQSYIKSLQAQLPVLSSKHTILERLGDLAIQDLQEAEDCCISTSGWMPSDTQRAKLYYRYALCYRLAGDPRHANEAMDMIDLALEAAPADVVLEAERQVIIEWMTSALRGWEGPSEEEAMAELEY